MRYDAFISYSHSADLELAKHLRDGLQKLSKPWNRRRALSIFLDQSSLELSSELGDSLGDRLDDTEWLVLLMSEQSAASKWVGEEIKEWAAARSKDQIALVLTGGTVVWDEVARDFDYDRSTAVNANMRNLYTGQDSEPLYLDLSWTKSLPGGEEALGLDVPRFRDAIATVSAAIQGKSKDEVEGEDIRQHRRLVRLRRSAVSALCVLTVAAMVAGVVAWIARGDAIEQRGVAETQAKRAESRALASDALNKLDSEPDLAALLALESARVADTADARGALAEVLTRPTNFLERNAEHDQRVTAAAFSESGRLAATADSSGVVRIWDVSNDPDQMHQAVVRPGRIDAEVWIRDVFVDDDGTVRAMTDDARIIVSDVSSCDTPKCAFEVIETPEDFAIAALGPDLLAGETSDGFVVVYSFDDDFDFEEVAAVDVSDVDVSDVDVSVAVTVLSFSPDGTHLGFGIGKSAAIWRWADGDPVYLQLDRQVLTMAFSPADDPVVPAVAAVGQEGGAIQLASVDAPELAAPVVAPLTSDVLDLAFRQRTGRPGFELASAHDGGQAALWAVASEVGVPPSGARSHELNAHNESVFSIGFSASGRLVSGDFDGETIWWLDTSVAVLGEDVANWAGSDDVIGAIDFVDADHVVALERLSGAVWVTEMTTGRSTQLEGVDAASLDASNGVIAVGLHDGTTVLHDAAGRAMRALDGHQTPVDWTALSSDANRLVAWSHDDVPEGERVKGSTLVRWDLDAMDQLELDVPEGFVVGTVFVEGDLIVVGGESADLLPVALVFDFSTGARTGRLEHSTVLTNSVWAVALSADGATLALGSNGGRITLWNTMSFEPISSNEFRGGAITGIAFADDDATMISVDVKGQVLMWDVSEQRAFGELGGPTNALYSLDLDTQSGLLVVGGDGGVSMGWSLQRGVWRSTVCALARRNMTVAEWELHGDGTTRVRHCPEFPMAEGPVVDAVFAVDMTN